MAFVGILNLYSLGEVGTFIRDRYQNSISVRAVLSLTKTRQALAKLNRNINSYCCEVLKQENEKKLQLRELKLPAVMLPTIGQNILEKTFDRNKYEFQSKIPARFHGLELYNEHDDAAKKAPSPSNIPIFAVEENVGVPEEDVEPEEQAPLPRPQLERPRDDDNEANQGQQRIDPPIPLQDQDIFRDDDSDVEDPEVYQRDPDDYQEEAEDPYAHEAAPLIPDTDSEDEDDEPDYPEEVSRSPKYESEKTDDPRTESSRSGDEDDKPGCSKKDSSRSVDRPEYQEDTEEDLLAFRVASKLDRRLNEGGSGSSSRK